MNKQTITLTTGETFPVDMSTLGAMLLFKKETGKEITEADTSDLSDLAALIWAGTAAASEVAGKDFPYTAQQMANRVTGETLRRWAAQMKEETAEPAEPTSAEESKKKSGPES